MEQANVKPNSVTGLVSGLAACLNTAPSLPPALLAHLGRTHCAWHQSLALLRLHQARLESRPADTRDGTLDSIRDCQAQLYQLLNEQDTWYGLHRLRLKTSPDTAKALAFEQQVWLLLNSSA